MMYSTLNRESTDIELAKYIDIALKRRWIIAATIITAAIATLLYVFTATPIYQAKSLLLIEKARDGGAGFSENTIVENTQDDYYQTQYMLLKSDTLLEKVYTAQNLDKTHQFRQPSGLNKLKAAVNISPVRRSRLVHIEVESPDPKLAARVANAVSEAYVRQNLENQLFISREILQALSVDPKSPEGRRLQESLPAVVNNPLIQQLKADHMQIQSKLAQLSKRYTPKHPERLAVESNMHALSAQIKVETDRVVAALKTELSGQLKGNNVRVVDPAKVPNAPLRPRKLRALLLSLLAGSLAGFLLAILFESLDQTIRTQEDVEQKLHQPFLGVIPQLERPAHAKVYASLTADTPSLTSEAFRNLRTMVDFANVTNTDRSILITSAVQPEGKSYIACNLAVAYAQLGESILIIDGDLRRPQAHRNFQLSAKRGLSDFLASGHGIDRLAMHIQKTDVPNLNLLPCGTRPPNPSELLNTPRLSALFAWAKQNYDRLIVDCTPLYPIHDTLLWGRHIRTAVFVVRYGKTRVQLINDGIRRLTTSGVKLAGLAINSAKPGGLTYADYGHYYRQYYRNYGEVAKEA